jgi:hypothetical protein
MGWIKRNLFFVISGLVSLALLGGAGFFIYTQWDRNSVASEKLNQIYETLGGLAQENPAPGNEKVNNTAIAKQQEQEVRAWLTSARNYFQPVPAIPRASGVTSEIYASALRRTIDQMRRSADSSGVSIPPKYNFSFEVQLSLMKFAPGSLDMLAAQLGEVKAITDILFTTRINALDSIQRVRVSDDDISGSQADYTDLTSVTNDLAVLTPYVITFRSFTPELAKVLSGFAAASNTFIIKSINIQPTSGAAAGLAPQPVEGIPGTPPNLRIPGEFTQPPPAAVQPGSPPKGGLQTLLKEQLLRVVMEIRLVKLLPKS